MNGKKQNEDEEAEAKSPEIVEREKKLNSFEKMGRETGQNLNKISKGISHKVNKELEKLFRLGKREEKE